MDEEYRNRSAYAKALAQGAIRKEIGEIDNRYGRAGLDARSHGESFLQFFQARFTPDGLYLLDEPEAPLSPLRQLGLLALLNDMVGQGAQFIIATHSPILMAFPNATILRFSPTSPRGGTSSRSGEEGRGGGGNVIEPVAYDEVEHVKVTRDFLANPQRFLQHLL
jgi:predicted ATPase